MAGRIRKPNHDEQFWDSAKLNKMSYIQYFNRLKELAMGMFEWENLPDTVDERFLELTLFEKGYCLYFNDTELGGDLALPCMIGKQWNVYQIPVGRTAYATNGYNKELTDKNSVIIYNNMVRTNSALDVEIFSRRLAELDRTIDVNAKAQKTPIIIQCNETRRLTMKNLYAKYEGNEPFIFADKNFDLNSLKVLKTDAPYVGDKLYTLKTQIWNEALTYLGISNVNTVKRERMISDEVVRSMGGVIANRHSRLEARKQACKQINKMFGTDINVKFRDDVDTISTAMMITMDDEGTGGEPNNE